MSAARCRPADRVPAARAVRPGLNRVGEACGGQCPCSRPAGATMSDPDLPTPEKPTVPGDSDDHNPDYPEEYVDGVPAEDRSDAQRSGRSAEEISDPGGDSD